jgi:DNA-binding MarR family transcriptional regulator
MERQDAHMTTCCQYGAPMSRSREQTLALVVADVFELAGAFRRQGERFAGETGQTQARWQLLSVLSEGDWTVSDAARRLGVSRQAVQRIADAIVSDGLARYEDNPAHRRASLVRPTRSGREALASITQRSSGWRAELAEKLGAGELDALHGTLRKLLATVQEGAAGEGLEES